MLKNKNALEQTNMLLSSIRFYLNLFIISMAAVFFFGSFFEFPPKITVSPLYQGLYQDIPLLPLLSAIIFIHGKKTTHAIAHNKNIKLNLRTKILAILLLIFIIYLGNHFVFLGYDLTRDEQMANFDAFIFSAGRLFWEIPAAWRPFAEALNQTFMLPVGAHEGWVSAYLPINALFRAITGLVAPTSLTSPALVGMGAVSLLQVSKRLWPDSPGSQFVTFILYAGSSQILISGMTAFAMTGHLCLNLVWLALFLRGGRLGHTGAILVGFLATGLHQPLFHPLFALPFLCVLVREKRRLLAIYASSYIVIGAFWTQWPIWISALASPASPIASSTQGLGYVDRLIGALRPFDMQSASTMAVNLLRFAMWQHLSLLPLAALGTAIFWRREPLVRALAVGFLLPIVAMAVLLPLQANGWGYRYVHGVLGNACLLAGYGWRFLEMQRLEPRRIFLGSSIASFLVVLPIHAAMVRHMIRPYDQISHEIASIPARMVIIDDMSVPYASDEVINCPDLSNRPIRLMGSKLKPDQIPALCGMGSIAFFDAPRLRPIADLYGTKRYSAATKPQQSLERMAAEARCSIVAPGGVP